MFISFLETKKNPIKKKFISRKKIKKLNTFYFTSYYNYYKKKKVFVDVKRSISLKNLKTFFILYKQLFYSINSHRRHTRTSSLHKYHFKKLNKKNYFQSYHLYVESYICSILYKSRLIPNIKYMKQFIHHNNLYVNQKLVKNYSYKTKPLDFIHVHKNFNFLNPTQSFFDKDTKKFINFVINRLSMFIKFKKSLYFLKLKILFLNYKKSIYLYTHFLYFHYNFFFFFVIKKLLSKFLEFFMFTHLFSYFKFNLINTFKNSLFLNSNTSKVYFLTFKTKLLLYSYLLLHL